MIRVVVAEDSPTARQLIVEVLRSDRELAVVGEAVGGAAAVEMTRRLRPDVVLMDIAMPGIDGLEATRQIMTETPTPVVIVSATLDPGNVEGSMHALRAGAVAVLAKLAGPTSDGFEKESRQFLRTVKLMAQVRVVRHHRRPAPPVAPARPLDQETRMAPVGVVAVAASTGGPAAIHAMLSGLDGGFPAPILIVQHIAEGFVSGFADWLDMTLDLPVQVARPGSALAAGTVYVAPDDYHLGVHDAAKILLSKAPPVGGFRPSATFLFRSVARSFGDSSLAIVLTGMGHDGVEGLRDIRDAGGRIIVQDQASSVVFGMPGSAVAAGLVDTVLPIAEIAARLSLLAK